MPPTVSFLDGVDAGGARARLNEITGTLRSKRSFNMYTLFSFIQHNTITYRIHSYHFDGAYSPRNDAPEKLR